MRVDVSTKGETRAARIGRDQQRQCQRHEIADLLLGYILEQVRFRFVVTKEGRVADLRLSRNVAHRDLIEMLELEQFEQRTAQRRPRAHHARVRARRPSR